MLQVYCNDENGVNQWLRDNQDVEVLDIKLSTNNDGEYIMVVYETKETKQEVTIKQLQDLVQEWIKDGLNGDLLDYLDITSEQFSYWMRTRELLKELL